MAIPRLYSHLALQWKGLVRDLCKGSTCCDLLCIDLNSLLYSCLNEAKDELSFAQLVFDNIKHLTKLVSCSKELYIAFDGVPPFAKFKEQAERRSGRTSSPKDGINPHVLSPGTKFIFDFQLKLEYQMKNFAKEGGLEVIISNTSEPGEGEHKIMNHIKKRKDNKVVIYGIDADLIVLGIISTCSDISLIREHIKTKKLPLGTKKYQILSVKKLRSHLLEGYAVRDLKYLFDIVLVIIMMGNDFTPAPKGIGIYEVFSMIDQVKGYHNEYPEELVVDFETGTINWENFNKLQKFLYELDLQQWKDEYPSYKDRVKAIFLSLPHQEIQNLSLIEKRAKVKEILEEEFTKWRFENYSKWENVSRDQINTITKDYLQSLEWIIKYYVTGDSDKHCVYEHEFTPRISDLGMVGKFEKDLPKEIKINPIHHLALILPESSKKLLPEDYQKENIPELSTLNNYDTLNSLINHFLKLDRDFLTLDETLRNFTL